MFHDNGFYWMMGLKCAANLHDNFESIIKKIKKTLIHKQTLSPARLVGIGDVLQLRSLWGGHHRDDVEPHIVGVLVAHHITIGGTDDVALLLRIHRSLWRGETVARPRLHLHKHQHILLQRNEIHLQMAEPPVRLQNHITLV